MVGALRLFARASLFAGALAAGCSPRVGSPVTAAPSPRLDTQPGHWTDERGAPVVLSSLEGTPVVLTAIYASCTTRCPLTVEKVRAVDAAFRSHGRPAAVYLLTLDPANDTPRRLLQFKEDRHMPEDWHFLRGSMTDTRTLARMLGVHPAVDDAHVDHEVGIAIFGADGALAHRYEGWSFDVSEAVSVR